MQDEVSSEATQSNRRHVYGDDHRDLGISATFPRPRTPLIGRRHELDLLNTMLIRDQVPLVTLTGPGGVGKTRLALQCAFDVAPAFSHGVCFVDLSAVRDFNLVLPTIASALDASDQGGTSLLTSMVGYLETRQLLLVLDNFEQVVEAGPQLAELLERCPRLTILVTSRVVLRLSAEQCVVVQPLADPDAVALFTARACAANPWLDTTSVNSTTVAEICRRLDHLPLAIELAAARVAVLPLPALLARLERSLGILVDGHRDRPGRLRTMRGAIAWSYDLLPLQVQVVFRQLAVFDGGFQLDGATAIVGGADESDVFDAIALLVAHSLVSQAGAWEAPEPRFAMLETVREFGLEQLERHGERMNVERRHAAWFAALWETALPELRGPQQSFWRRRVREEIGNVRAAIAWSLDHDLELAMRLIRDLQFYWRTRQEMSYSLNATRRLLVAWRGSQADRAAALIDASRTMFSAGQYVEGREYATEAAGIYRGLGDDLGVANAMLASGHNLISLYKASPLPAASARLDAARAAFQKQLDIGRAISDRRLIASAYRGLGNVALHQGETHQAVELLTLALDFVNDMGLHDAFGWALRDLALALFLNGNQNARAAELLSQSLAMHHQLDEGGWGTGQVLKTVALLLLDQGHTTDAIRLYTAAESILSKLGLPIDIPFQLDEEPMVVAICGTDSSQDWADAAQVQPPLLPAEGVTMALALLSRDSLAPAGTKGASMLASEPLGLTPRESEVLALLAQGLSDREIAARLSLSPHTVHGHVSHVLGKLGVESRTAAVAFAIRNGMS